MDELELEFKVSTPLYQRIEEHQVKWSSGKKGKYGGGVANNSSDPYRVERISMMGEWAFGSGIGMKPDETYREGGDKFDFELGATIDVKTHIREKDEVIVQYADHRNKNPYYYELD